MNKRQIFILLSSKSSGSTALQSYLHHNYNIKPVRVTEHFENETLYWTKAASILGLSQSPMHRSSVPYSKEMAISSLQKFLIGNEVKGNVDRLTKMDLFELFYQTAERTGDLIVEKSPHHLYNESNIQLICEFKEYIKDRAVVNIIGLVRSPLDTIYSAWDRWRYNCAKFEMEWMKSYDNLAKWGESDGMAIFRYEDIVKSTNQLDRYLTDVCALSKVSTEFVFKADSVGRWQRVSAFRHGLSVDTIRLAKEFGYDHGLVNPNPRSSTWNLAESLNEWKFQLKTVRKAFKLMLSKLKIGRQH